jgi:lipopolysaccharide exporter
VTSTSRDASAGLARRAARGTLWVALGSWTNWLMLLIVVVVLAGRLGPRDFGVLCIGAFCSNILTILGTLGRTEALVYQRERVREAAKTAFLILTVVGVLAATAVVMLAPHLASLFQVPEAAWVIQAYGLMAGLNVARRAPFAMLTRELAFERRVIPEVMPALLGGATSIVLALRGVGVWSMVLGDAVRYVIAFVLTIAVLPERYGLGWDARSATEMWRYGRNAVTAQGFDVALQNVDYALIGRLLGPVRLGYYTLAFRVAILPFLVIPGVRFPVLARVFPERQRAREIFVASFRPTMAVMFLLTGASSCWRRPSNCWAPAGIPP